MSIASSTVSTRVSALSIQITFFLLIIFSPTFNHNILSANFSMPGLMQMRCPILTPPLIIQFMAVFHNDQVIFYYTSINIFSPHYYHTLFFPIFPSQFNICSLNIFLQDFIQIPSFYHRQWAPNYP